MIALLGLSFQQVRAAATSATKTDVQAVYVVPADVTPVEGRNEATSATVLAVQGWFAEQADGAYPVFVRTADQITVPTVTLSQTHAELLALSSWDADATMTSQIHEQVPGSDGSQLLLFVESEINTDACGYQSTMIVMPIENCDIAPSLSSEFPYGATYLVAHELTHMLGGASRSCATNTDGTGHVDDDNRDIIWSGSGGRDWANLMLDPGNDDYYNHEIEGCPDISDSPLIGTWSGATDPGGAVNQCGGLAVTHQGTEFDDDLYGTAGDDVIAGLGGNDRIWGLAGNDVICAGDGNDRVYGGSGDNVLYGEGGIDKMRAGVDSDRLYGGDDRDFLKGGHGDDQVWGEGGSDRIRGSVGDDEIWGGDDDDVLWGGPGNDVVNGDAGNDIVKGSAGTDTCVGGPGNDTAHVTCNQQQSFEASAG